MMVMLSELKPSERTYKIETRYVSHFLVTTSIFLVLNRTEDYADKLIGKLVGKYIHHSWDPNWDNPVEG
jgi:hypothetical protein